MKFDALVEPLKMMTFCSKKRSSRQRDNESDSLEKRIFIHSNASIFDVGEWNRYYWNQNTVENKWLIVWKFVSTISKGNFKIASFCYIKLKMKTNDKCIFGCKISRATNNLFFFEFQIMWKVVERKDRLLHIPILQKLQEIWELTDAPLIYLFFHYFVFCSKFRCLIIFNCFIRGAKSQERKILSKAAVEKILNYINNLKYKNI